MTMTLFLRMQAERVCVLLWCRLWQAAGRRRQRRDERRLPDGPTARHGDVAAPVPP